MSFLAPGYVLLTALFAVPIAIHLIGRSRAKVRRFAAIDLLLRGERRVARRTRIRQWLLLLLRMAVVLLLAGYVFLFKSLNEQFQMQHAIKRMPT